MLELSKLQQGDDTQITTAASRSHDPLDATLYCATADPSVKQIDGTTALARGAETPLQRAKKPARRQAPAGPTAPRSQRPL